MIIVTGASGFVGQKLAPKLIKKYGRSNILFLIYKHDSRLHHTNHDYLKKIKANIKYIDLLDKKSLARLPKKPKLVIHLAANTNTARPDHRVNDKGIKNLYESFGKLDKDTHFIHIGTMVSVSGRLNCNMPINENSPDNPTNEYTRTKVEGENYIKQMCLQDGFKLTVLRPNTIYGQGMRPNSLFDMLKKEVDKKSIISRLNWPGKSALIHVDDVVKNIIRSTEQNPQPGKPEKFLLYSENLTINELNKLIYKRLGLAYHEISLPNLIWKVISFSRIVIPRFEKLLAPQTYNQLWRFSIIVDDVVWCKSTKLDKHKNKRISSRISEVL